MTDFEHLSVEGVLGHGGALATAVEAFSPRAGQVEMALAVERALRKPRHLIVEAQTGTGKTLAYLVPALLSQKRVVISTATRTLQDQLWNKDLPLLAEAFDMTLSVSLLKGRANYLCLHRFERFSQAPLFLAPDDAKHWNALNDWALKTKTGDRAESDLPDDWLSWSQVSTTSEGCLGSVCPQFESCHVTQARRQAEKSQLIVVNHALYFADLSLRARSEDDAVRIIPRHDAVIFDEAHALEDVASNHFASTFSSAKVNTLVHDGLQGLTKTQVSTAAIAALLVQLKAAAEAFFREAWIALSLEPGKQVRVDSGLLFPLSAEFESCERALRALLAGCEQQAQEESLQLVLRRGQELLDGLRSLWHADRQVFATWAEGRTRGVSFQVAPIDIGQSLQSALFQNIPTVVLTSATLAVSNGEADPFAFSRQRFGLSGNDSDAVAVSSPFEFSKQAALYMPSQLAVPTSPLFTEQFCDEVFRLVHLTGGRAFLLFTSLRQLDAVYERLSPRLTMPTLKQGEKPKATLLKLFQRQPSVLFGSQSFWEGVDVPGQALSLVVIDRLPFEPPDVPLFAARMEALQRRGQRPFDAYQLPQAALKLRQGFGRLIRRTSDFGIVAVLDSRLRHKSYGQTFIRSLPNAQQIESFANLEAWWQKKTEV